MFSAAQREKCPDTEFFLSISRYSVRMRENTDQKKLRTWTLFTQCLGDLFPPISRVTLDSLGAHGDVFTPFDKKALTQNFPVPA